MIREVELKYRLNNQMDYKTLLDALPGEHRLENQINYFFDTPDLKLKAQHIFLRLRKSNELFKFTCKAKPEGIDKPAGNLSIHDEWEQIIDPKEAQYPLELLNKDWPGESKSSKQTRLSLLKRINQTISESVQLVASFKNTRIHVPYSIDKYELNLEFDKTDFGNGLPDYELELELPETLSIEKAQTALETLFKQFKIETGPSQGKAERFFALRVKSTPNILIFNAL